MNIMKSKPRRAFMIACAAGLATFAGALWAQSDQAGSSSPALTQGDEAAKTFLRQAIKMNNEEAAYGEVGVRRAQNPELKTFAQQMENAHLKNDRQLKPIAQKYGVTEDQKEPRKEHKDLTRLEKTSGNKFDKEFATLMLRTHQKAIREYQQAAAQMQAPDVKQYAQQTLPQLQQHFQQAEQVAKAVGVDQSTIDSIANKVPTAVGGTGDGQSTLQGTGSSTQPGLDTQTEKGAGGKQLQPAAPGAKPGE